MGIDSSSEIHTALRASRVELAAMSRCTTVWLLALLAIASKAPITTSVQKVRLPMFHSKAPRLNLSASQARSSPEAMPSGIAMAM